MKKRSERESGRVGILRGFPDSPHSEEFEVADRQSLGLEQQVAQVLVADPERHGDRRGGDLGPPSRPCVSSSNWRGNDWGPAVLSDYRLIRHIVPLPVAGVPSCAAANDGVRRRPFWG